MMQINADFNKLYPQNQRNLRETNTLKTLKIN